MAREKKVRVSEEELDMLKQYRNDNYDSAIPLGYIISELVEGQE